MDVGVMPSRQAPDRDWSVLVLLAWHAGLALVALCVVLALPSAESGSCDEFCFTPRDLGTVIGLFLGVPALLLSLVAAGFIRWVVRRSRSENGQETTGRQSVAIGTRSALGGLAIAGVLAGLFVGPSLLGINIP